MSIFADYFKKNYCFSAFISRKNVFLSDIINEVIKKGIMKELVEKVAELYAAFEKMQKLSWKTVIKQPELVHVRLLWKSKSNERIPQSIFGSF